MSENNALTYGSAGVTGLNLMVGIITMDTLNLAVAGLGIVAMITANAYKIVVALIQLRDLRRNNWKLPKSETHKKNEEG